MNSRSIKSTNGMAEIGIIEHDGKEFSAGGFSRTDTRLVAYLGKDGVLTQWDGTKIGTYRITSSWPTPCSFVSSRMNQVEATLADGSKWTGRSAGVGMCYTAKPKAR